MHQARLRHCQDDLLETLSGVFSCAPRTTGSPQAMPSAIAANETGFQTFLPLPGLGLFGEEEEEEERTVCFWREVVTVFFCPEVHRCFKELLAKERTFAEIWGARYLFVCLFGCFPFILFARGRKILQVAVDSSAAAQE